MILILADGRKMEHRDLGLFPAEGHYRAEWKVEGVALPITTTYPASSPNNSTARLKFDALELFKFGIDLYGARVASTGKFLFSEVPQIEKMRAVINKANKILSDWIVPNSGITDHQCLNSLLALLDGPETREALK